MLVMSFCSLYFTSYKVKHCYKLCNLINCQFWHHSYVQLEELPCKMVSHSYLIFRNKWELTFSYHWETLYEPHCLQCWVNYTHAGHVLLYETHSRVCWVKYIHASHVILQLILYKLWSKTLLQAFWPHQLPILTSQLHPAQRATLRNGVKPLPHL